MFPLAFCGVPAKMEIGLGVSVAYQFALCRDLLVRDAARSIAPHEGTLGVR